MTQNYYFCECDDLNKIRQDTSKIHCIGCQGEHFLDCIDAHGQDNFVCELCTCWNKSAQIPSTNFQEPSTSRGIKRKLEDIEKEDLAEFKTFDQLNKESTVRKLKEEVESVISTKPLEEQIRLYSEFLEINLNIA